MKLYYRGVVYDTTKPNFVEPIPETPYTLNYRGVNIHVDPSIPPTPPPAGVFKLTYRGVHYDMVRNAQGAVTYFAHSNHSNQPAAQTAVAPTRIIQQQLQKVHQENLLKNLRRRLKAAQERGDQHLVDLLQAELQQITA